MKASLKVILSVVFVFFSTFAFAQNGERVKFLNGNFSICPPAGWQVFEFPGLEYDVFVGPTEQGFSANIIFMDESYDGGLQEYVDLNILNMVKFLQNYEVVKRNAARTNSGISGEYIIIKHEQSGYNIEQIIYIFPVKNKKYLVFTYTVLENLFERYLPLFENSAKTFEIF
jgi:hypothetical protein